ncbi:uncharacterized protein LOC116248725 [Nymphaea colorata]|nr:uncharacterized protein LOC116248725 [Nymphaea colorata]
MWSLSSLLDSVLPCHAAERCGSPRPLLSPATIATRPYTYSFSPSIPPAIVGRARCLYVNATRKKEGARMRTHYVDVELGNDDDDGFDDFDEEGENEDVGGSDDGELLPFDKMRRWLEKRPRGFGDGKTYETSLEDQLLQEIEQSRKAQEANLNNLKRSKSKSESMKQPLKLQQDVIPGRARIRVGNLPKKKNIHRDLRSAFKGFPGLLNISPAVTGNKTTRDPICKGFAFLDFESDATADRFLEIYSGQTVVFGKIEKQISCDALKPDSLPKSGSGSAQSNVRYSPRLKIVDLDTKVSGSDSTNLPMEPSYRSEIEDPAGTITPAGNSDKEDIDSESGRGLVLNFQNSESSINDTEEETASSSISTSRKQKKMLVRKKQVKVPKPEKGLKSLKVLGSASRLKIRERAVLTDVFSKYGANTPSSM